MANKKIVLRACVKFNQEDGYLDPGDVVTVPEKDCNKLVTAGHAAYFVAKKEKAITTKSEASKKEKVDDKDQKKE